MNDPMTPEPKRGPLWSLLDWSLWGAGMGDTFREPLADTMLSAVPAETITQAEAVMAEFIERRKIEKTGVTVYQEQRDELDRMRLSIAGMHARITELGAAQSTVIAHRDAQIIAWLAKKAGEEGRSNRDSRTRGDVLARMADKLSRGAVRPPLSKGPDPLIVSRFDVAMEPAPEEEQVLTVGCIDENGRPVALLLDMEARSKVARWLAPELNDTGKATTP